MPRPPYIDFPLDPSLRSMLEKWIRSPGSDDSHEEWAGNILSKKTVAYLSGRIGRAGEPVNHRVDPDELEQIKRLAHDVLKVMQGVPVGMGSKSPETFHEFYSPANVDDPPPEKIDAELIRARFGGTICPSATITVEPLAESGTWWDEVTAHCESSSRLVPWRQMAHWFRTQPDFVDSAFVRIGDGASAGPALPRLALGLTRGGSLAGILGCCSLA